MTEVVVLEQADKETVEVTRSPETLVTIDAPPPLILEVVARGPQGPPGPPGPFSGNATSIVGYPVNLVSGEPDDLLSFTGSEWRNKPQKQVTDGGNF